MVPPVPGNGFELLTPLVFVLPGSVYQFVRSRLRGPSPDDASAVNRALRAVGVSAGLVGVYVLLAGPTVLSLVARVQGDESRRAMAAVRPLAAWTVALLFVVPGFLAALAYAASRQPRPRALGWLRAVYDPTPRAWDFAFGAREPGYVRIRYADGTCLGGWYSGKSFVSGYPEPREIFLEVAHHMAPDGAIGAQMEGSRGAYVRCDDVRVVEFVDMNGPSP